MSYAGIGSHRIRIPVLAGVVSTDSNSYIRLGTFKLDPDTFGVTAALVLAEAILETSDGIVEARARIYDLTAGAALGADPLLTTNSSTPILEQAIITPPSGERLYEAHLLMNGGTAPENVTCSGFWVTVAWSDFA